MASFVFKPAVRTHIPLIVGISGPTKAGKSLSALRLATGLAGGKPIAMLNTEGPRGHQYCDRFQYIAADLSAPFRPIRYTEALQMLKTMEVGCVILDSVSHMHDGPGGILEWHEEILDRVAGTDYAKRERSTFVAWVEPKAAENQFIYALQELTCPVILCLRAKEKIKISKGKVEELGWQPIVGERIAFETMFTLMLPPHAKGVPDLSISDMREPFDAMIQPGRQLDEELGAHLAAWSKGIDQQIGAEVDAYQKRVRGSPPPVKAPEAPKPTRKSPAPSGRTVDYGTDEEVEGLKGLAYKLGDWAGKDVENCLQNNNGRLKRLQYESMKTYQEQQLAKLPAVTQETLV